MKKFLICMVCAVCFFASASTLHARGGGGCLKQGTLVLTPSGNIPIERLRPGDAVLGVNRGSFTRAVVQSVATVQPDQYIQIIINGRIGLAVTKEHPIEISFGVFRMAAVLKIGDRVNVIDQKKIVSGTVTSVTHIAVTAPAYNLLVSPAGNYIANGVVVHNKGCFLPETPIRKADGTDVPLSRIRRNDRLLALHPDGTMTTATVRKIITHDVDEYRIVRVGDSTLHVTNEHPFYTGSGEFKTLEALNVGDSIYVFDGTGLHSRRIESIETVREKTRVYNLQTNAPNTYVANGAVVHNKGGGCFPAGTKIITPDGDIQIEHASAGDVIVGVDANDRPVAVRILETHVTRSPLLLVHTTWGILRTTNEHPLALAKGGFSTAETLARDDEILIWQDGKSRRTTVTGLQSTEKPETVYNLTVDWPHTFIADGFIVHNKGGGGGGSRSSSYRSSSSSRSSGGSSDASVADFLIVFFVIGSIIVVIVIIVTRKKSRDENLDYVYSASEIAKKSDNTMKLLEFIAKQDQSLAPAALKKIAASTFLTLQECWQAREYAPMQPLLVPDLYQEHLLQIQSMVRNHEINMIAQLKIEQVDLVNVRYTIKEDHREFTALITAAAQDYYIDDRTRAKLRGDETPQRFQEFWTFHFMNGSWLLREIEQSGESDALKEENFVEQFTDKTIQQIYGQATLQEGPAGPWLEKDVEAKGSRIERMLNFLVQTDKLWDRKAMLLVSRNVFIKVTVAWESGDPAKVPVDDLFPEINENLRREITRNRDLGVSIEFRNLCVRKTELVLVSNFPDNGKDEFVARVRAHAQKIMKQKNVIIRQDNDVTPFEQYLTFGRLDKQWKLKEIVNSRTAQELIKQENVDQESSREQLRWYYQHKRAI